MNSAATARLPWTTLSHLIAVALFALLAPTAPDCCGQSPSILRTDRVWNSAPSNSFTDMVWFNNHFVLAFREGPVHGVPAVGQLGGYLRVLQSTDGLSWASTALLQGTANEDYRDAKLSITPDGRLMLTGAAAFKTATGDRQSKAWFSNDGAAWTAPSNIGDYNYWLWGTAWNNGQVYSVGYGLTNTSVADRDKRTTRLYRSNDGTNFSLIVPSLTSPSGLTGGGETALLFRGDGTAVALSRRDSGNFEALIGTSSGDFTQWTWHIVPDRIGGPELIELPDGRIVAASRRFIGSSTTTALYWLNPTAGTMTPFLTLPSSGDTSYAGMVWHDDRLWVSYYSSHEGKPNVYVSQVQVPLDADYNGNGLVDAADYVLWRKARNNNVSYDVWQSRYGTTFSGAAAGAAVPEPNSIAFMAGAVTILFISSMRRRVVANS